MQSKFHANLSRGYTYGFYRFMRGESCLTERTLRPNFADSDENTERALSYSKSSAPNVGDVILNRRPIIRIDRFATVKHTGHSLKSFCISAVG